MSTSDVGADAGRAGLAYGLAAFGLWGLVPAYFKSLEVPPAELLAQRITWTAVLFLGFLTIAGRWRMVLAALAHPATRYRLLASTLLIAANWYLFLAAVNANRVSESSLGYYILPLANVALGLCLFGERLRRWQVVAVALAGLGVAVDAASGDRVPWLALGLALTFGLYGLARKTANVDGMTGLAVETLLLAPISVAALAWQASYGGLSFGKGAAHDGLILAAGVVTAVPLVCFAQAARRLPMTTLGFLQYLSPTMQLLLAVVVYGERLTTPRLACFVLIWVGLTVFTIDAVRQFRRQRLAAEAT